MSDTSAIRRPYRVKEVAELLDAGLSTVYLWISQGHIKSNRVGGTILVPAEEIDRIIYSSAA